MIHWYNKIRTSNRYKCTRYLVHLFLLLYFFICVLFFCCPIYLSSPFFFSLPLSRNSDPGSHMYDSRLFSPLPATVRAFHVYLDKTPTLSSLVDSRRIAPTHVIHRYSHHFIPFIFLLIIKSKSHHGGIRTPLATILIAAFEGNH